MLRFEWQDTKIQDCTKTRLQQNHLTTEMRSDDYVKLCILFKEINFMLHKWPKKHVQRTFSKMRTIEV